MRRTRVLLKLGIVLLSATQLQARSVKDDLISELSNTHRDYSHLEISYVCEKKPSNLSYAPSPRAYPGEYRPERGVLTLQGSKVKLDRFAADKGGGKKTLHESIAFDGSLTKTLRQWENSQKKGRSDGVVTYGRSHKLRRWFSPLWLLSANGDSSLIQELRSMEVEVADTEIVGGASCVVAKLTLRSPKGGILRTFKIYLDPEKDLALRKVEKYWYNFACLERVMEVHEFRRVNALYVPVRASHVQYVKEAGQRISHPATQQDLRVTNIRMDKARNSHFEIVFPQDTKVSDYVADMVYRVGHTDPELPVDLSRRPQ